MELVFYVPGQPWVIDFAHVRGELIVSQLENQTLDEMQVRHPGAKIVPFHEAAAEIHATHRGQPRPVPRDDYEFARAMVVSTDGNEVDGESFKLRDFGAGALAQVYACVGGTYWMFEDACTLPHEAVLRRVQSVMAE
ncbi:hypothetical protein [Pseudomonas mosselii]|uniref:Uncharacterized protein n=1 Tax=Pseudomonas mosselii TaxID=78327 RepID=A0A7W2JZR7_9PSED|nr:hypothetical protein [Pseudomonas mosselii]MBA6068102.1 hypothetical protein [Pseudomonas mosselii]